MGNDSPIAGRLYRPGTLFVKSTTSHPDQAADAQLLTDKWSDRKQMINIALLGEEAMEGLRDSDCTCR